MILTFPNIRRRHGHLVKPPMRFLFLVIAWSAITAPYVAIRARADDVGFPRSGLAIGIDRALGFGETPGERLQALVYGGGFGAIEWFAFIGWTLFFVAPWGVCLYVALLRPHLIMSLLTSTALLAYSAGLLFVLFPTEPPWMATDINRILVYKLEVINGNDPNIVAAFPSLHVGWPAMYALWLLRSGETRIGIVYAGIACWIAFAVMYFGEHYLADALGGFFLAWLVVRIAAPMHDAFANAASLLHKSGTPKSHTRVGQLELTQDNQD